MFRCSLIIFLAIVVVTACGSTQTLPSYPRTILGTITKIGGRVLVEQDPEATIGNKIYFSLSDETQIFQRIDSDLHAKTLDYLAVGQRVEVWADGVILETFPGQAGAAVIVITDPDEESTAEAVTLTPPNRNPDASGMITQAYNTVWIDQNLVLFITPTTQFFRRSESAVETIDAPAIKEGQSVDIWVDKIQNQQARAQVIVVISH